MEHFDVDLGICCKKVLFSYSRWSIYLVKDIVLVSVKDQRNKRKQNQ